MLQFDIAKLFFPPNEWQVGGVVGGLVLFALGLYLWRYAPDERLGENADLIRPTGRLLAIAGVSVSLIALTTAHNLPRTFNSNPGPGSDWHILFGTLGMLLGVLGIWLYSFAPRTVYRHDDYRTMLAENVGQCLMYVGFLLAFFAFCRIVDLPFFSMRLWLYLTLLTGLGLAAYLAYYMLRVYPKRVANIARLARIRELQGHHASA
jgi:divalent metal cation (Fe/Co/Zn/Cd) transporter